MTVDILRSSGFNEQRDDQAVRAVKAFRKLQPTLTSYARVITGQKNVIVQMAAQDNGSTDGKNIYFRPPIALGDSTPHDRHLCDKRDETGKMKCIACGIRESIIVTIMHEIAHIAFDSFESTTEYDKKRALEFALRETGTPYAVNAKARIDNAPKELTKSFIGLAQLVNEYLPFLLNCLEDARVNREMFKARPGLRRMFAVDTNEVFEKGFENRDRDGILRTKLWNEAPLNSQVMIGLFCKASGYDYSNWFHSKVVHALDDDEITVLIDSMDRINTAGGIFGLSFKVLARLRELGFCGTPQDPNPEPEEEDEDESDEENEDDDAPDGAGQPEPEGGAGSGDDDDSDSEGSEGEGDEPGDSSATKGSSVSPDNDQGSTEENTDSDDDAEGDDVDEEGSGSGGNSEDAGDDSDSDESESASADGGDSDPGGEGDQDGEGSSDAGSQSDGDSERTDGTPEGDGELGEDSSTSSSSISSEPPRTGEPDGGSDPDGNEGTASSGNEDEGSQGNSASPRSDDQAVNEQESGDSTETGSEDSPDDEPLDSGADDGYGGTELVGDDDEEDGPAPEWGDPSDVDPILKKWGQHDEKPKSIAAHEEQTAVDRAIVQGIYFTRPSKRVYGVTEHRFGDDPDPRSAWRIYHKTHRVGQTAEIEVPEAILQPAILKLRRAFTDNQIGRLDTNRKSGRVNRRVLGRRAWNDDERLFQKKTQPGKKDYEVIIGMDISGSTVGRNLALEKRAIMAQATMLDRVGVKFGIFAHTGDYHDPYSTKLGLDLQVYHIKDSNEPWNSKTIERLEGIGHSAANLDGHALEYLRKRADESKATEKIILYYSDGKMPAENHDEELEILVSEINTCRAKGYTLLGVGIRTDSPARHGLDTVEVHEDTDLVKVVTHLGKRLSGGLRR